MASNLVKFCTAALAGTIIGATYERWQSREAVPATTLFWPQLFSSASASSSPPIIRPSSPDNIISDRFGGKHETTPVDPKVAAEFLRTASKYGLPSKDNLRLFNDFLVSYDRRLRSPVWVMEHIHRDKLSGEATRKKSEFVEDTTIHEYFRATLKDFRNTGFDRGHMAAAANHKGSQEAMDQTFILSNISPQEREFNQGGWEILESYVRWRAKESKNVYCVTGPLYLPKKANDGNLYVRYRVIGDNFVSVPTHYFKVILVEAKNGSLSMEAFLMPNDNKLGRGVRLDQYRVPIDRLNTIERASGVIFFDQLQRNTLDTPTAIPSGFKPRVYHDSKSKVPLAA